MKRQVKFLLFSMLSVLIMLTACNQGSKPASTDSAAKQVKLRIAWAGDQQRHDVTLKAISLYEQQHPKVKFDAEFSGWDGYWDKMATQFAAKNGPDIIQIDTFNLLEYAGRNQLADISSGIKLDNVDKKLISGGEVGGKQYGIPIGNNAITLFYNKKVLDSLGVTLPKESMTWDQLIDVARKGQPKLEKGKYFMHDLSIQPVLGNGTDAYEMFQLGKGKGFLHTPDGKFNVDKQTYAEWINLWKQLRKEGIVPPTDVELSHKQQDPKQDLLVNGTVLLTQSYAAGFAGYNGMLPNSLSMIVVPSGAQFGGYLIPAQFFAVSANAKAPEEAKKFIDWFINDEKAGEILGFNRGVPVSSKVLDHLKPSIDDSAKLVIEMVDQTAKKANPFSSRPPGYNNFRSDVQKQSEKLAFDKTTIDKAFDDIKSAYSESIKEIK